VGDGEAPLCRCGFRFMFVYPECRTILLHSAQYASFLECLSWPVENKRNTSGLPGF
jgi:hypothetical protein